MMDLPPPKKLSNCKTLLDYAYRERYVYLTEYEEFFLHFRVPLKQFWLGNILGFDILSFDEWLGCGDECCRDVIFRKYGQDAVDCVKRIIQFFEETDE